MSKKRKLSVRKKYLKKMVKQARTTSKINNRAKLLKEKMK